MQRAIILLIGNETNCALSEPQTVQTPERDIQLRSTGSLVNYETSDSFMEPFAAKDVFSGVTKACSATL